MPVDRPNGRDRKRKHPSSPSNSVPRTSPYTPNRSADNYSPRNLGGGAGGNRSGRRGRQSSTSHQSQQSQQLQQPPSHNRRRAEEVADDSAMASTPTDPGTPGELYYWEFLSDANLRAWQSEGAARVQEALGRSIVSEDVDEVCIILQELVRATIEGRILIHDSAKFVTDIISAFPKDVDSGIDLQDLFLSTVGSFEDPTLPPPDNLSKLLIALSPSPIPTEIFALHLEPSTLAALGLVTTQFSKKAIKVTTSLIYKQRKHNLLREESEGYSKLITEFFTASYSPFPLEVVGRTGERVKGLVGAFELDPARVLDVLLDTAASTVVSNARFFVRLLRESAWWPTHLSSSEDEFSNTGKGREELKAEKERRKALMDVQFFKSLKEEGIVKFFEYRESSRGTGGNKVAAQLLGFKFRYYQNDDALDNLPENLVALSALLIKIGFIDLADLYPHLSPRGDDEMLELRASWLKKMAEELKVVKPNALAMAGSLHDDTLPNPPRSKPSASAPAEDKKPEEPKPKELEKRENWNQKVALLKHLLALGALPEAMFILGKYPFLTGPEKDIADALSRVLIQSIDTVYAPLKPENADMGIARTVVSAPGGGVDIQTPTRRKQMVTFTVSNLNLRNIDIDYRFFWEDWKDGVPTCRDATDVVILIETLGKLFGLRIGRDPMLMSMVCRIGRSVLEDPSCIQEDRDRWINLSRSIIVPSISFTEGNQGIVNEIWGLINHFPTETRYSIYGEWISREKMRIPDLKLKTSKTEKDTKDLLKRLSLVTIKPIALGLAKVAVSSPVTVMQVVLSQVETYDNLIECVVGAAKYFTPLAFDAIGFCALFSMSAAGKQSVQADGMLTSRWLKSLGQFCGQIYTRYYRQMDPAPILEYIARQLKQNKWSGLGVLQEIIQSMTGIDPEINLTDSQLQGLAGGPVARSVILGQFRNPKAEDSPGTVRALTDTLMRSGLATQLLILIAQARQNCLYRYPDTPPLKILGNLFDQINVVFGQYSELLQTGLLAEKYAEMIPSMGQLCQEFGLKPDIAWWIARSAINTEMLRIESPDGGEDVDMGGTQEENSGAVPEKTPWNPVLKKIMDELRPVVPISDWSGSLAFYVTFWHLSLHDIYVPMNAYKNLQSDISGLSKRTGRSRGEFLGTVDKLNEEAKGHIRHHSLVRKRLQLEKDHWFSEFPDPREVTNALVQYCLIPRIVLSPNDASFCSRFVRELHKMATPKFHTVGVFDAIFGKHMGKTVFTCTQQEAENLGRFLKEVLSDLHAWHSDKAQYEREAHANGKNLNGFTFRGAPMDWEDFRKLLYKWHKTIHNAIKNCLCSKEYMHIRNTVIVLKHIHKYFPSVDWIGRTVLEKVEEIGKHEKREDLKIASSTLLGLLKHREKDWVLVAAFQKGSLTEALTPAVSGSKQPSPVPTSTPTPTQQLPTDAVNASMQPNTASSTTTPNGPSPLAPNSNLPSKPDAEKEDGEIDDSKGSREAKRLPNLPQRPAVPPPPLRRQPSRDPPRLQQGQQSNEPARAGTPRRDEPPNVRPSQEMSRTLNQVNRGPPPQPNRPLPQHQLPDRPPVQQPHDRSRDMRESPRSVEVRGTAGRPVTERLPDRPSDRPTDRRPPSPRREGRDQHRRDGDRGRVREDNFQRPALPVRGDDRALRAGDRKELDLRMETVPNRSAQQPQPNPVRTDPRNPSSDNDRWRLERIDDRSRRHDRPDLLQTHQMEIDRPEPERRVLDRRASDQNPLRQQSSQDDLHSQRPPAGPRADVERERERRNRQEGPPTPKERDLFTGAPPRGPSGPSLNDFRETRHAPPVPHQDPNHGRLNPPDPIIPRGPRERAAPVGPRGSMNRVASSPSLTTTPATQRVASNNSPSVATPLPSPGVENKPLSIVSSGDNKVETQKSMENSAPSIIGSDTAGVHPDRLRNVVHSPQPQPPQPKSPVTQTQPSQQSASVHPSRLPAIQGASTPSASVTNPNPPSGPRVNTIPSAAPSAAPSPTTSNPPPPVKQGSPPTGPSRGDRGDDANHQRRRIMTMQNIIGQASGGGDTTQGSVIKGRASRRTVGTSGTLGRDNGRGTLPSGVSETARRGGNGNGSQPDSNRRGSLAGPEPGRPNSASGGSAEDRDRERDRDRPASDHGSRSGRHGRDRGDRDRDRDRERERDRAPRDGDRERDRDRGHQLERDRDRERGGMDRDRGLDRDRGQERDRDRDRESRDSRERERHIAERERDRDRESRRGGAVAAIGGSGSGRERDRDRDREKERDRRDARDRDRKHGRENDNGRKDDSKRRRRGEQGGGW